MSILDFIKIVGISNDPHLKVSPNFVSLHRKWSWKMWWSYPVVLGSPGQSSTLSPVLEAAILI